jgi:ABC-2 type transport system ATP-binding protein
MPGLTVRECLQLYAGYYPAPRPVDETLGLVDLDEPTTGFDPSARRAAWTVIEGLRDLGKTVFLTTHYTEEAERLADRIAVIADGRIVDEGTPHTLGGRQQAAAHITFTLPASIAAGELPAALGERAQSDSGGRVLVPSERVTPDLHELSGWALARSIELDELEVRRPTLEDVYLQLTSNDDTRS